MNAKQGIYKNHTNRSFKKMTEIEKKQTHFLSMVKKMKNKAKILSDLRFITNEILTNCAYHEKNIEEQFKKFNTLKVPKKEIDIISDAWDIKFKLGRSLLNDLEELIEYVKQNYN